MAVMGERVVPTPEAAAIKESAWGVVPPLLADLARREHRHPELPPTLPQDKVDQLLQGRHSPTTARKGGTQGPKGRGNLATRLGGRRHHPRRRHGPSPTPPSTQAGRHRRCFCGFVGKSPTH